MKISTQALQLDDNHLNEIEIVLASTCPICGVTLNPSMLSANLVYDEKEDEYTNCFVLNHCSGCNECFISKHLYNENTYIYECISSAPKNFFYHSFSTDIQNLSPDFVSIYNESLQAESLGMHSICGMGYRKALEFLVKDFAISNNPGNTQQITNLPLAQCIDNYISDARLKSLAKASAWLGNDATHYVKKHPQYGNEQLKSFINAFITFIDADLAYKKAQAFLSSN